MKSLGLISFVILLTVVSCQLGDKTSKQQSDENESALSSTYKSFINGAWNDKNMDALKSVSIENYIKNLNGIQVAGNQSEMQAHMKVYFIGFPDTRVTVDDVIIKDRYLFTHWTFTGTNTGVFGETAPTGKKIQVSGYSKIAFDEQGRMVQEDEYYNELELLEQLGYTLNPPILK